MQERNGQPQGQPTPALETYAQAAQNCRDIAQQVGIHNCDNDLNWRAAELVANTRYDEAVAAGHSVDETLKVGRKK
jgi:hypothetical protein